MIEKFAVKVPLWNGEMNYILEDMQSMKPKIFTDREDAIEFGKKFKKYEIVDYPA